MTIDRRRFLRRMALYTATAPAALGLASAQMGHDHSGHDTAGHDDMHQGDMGHGHMQHGGPASAAPAVGSDIIAPLPIPWRDGVCAFCGMTVSTPMDGGNPAGFRERTYGQIRLAPGHEVAGEAALHYESLACMFNHAYTLGVFDGHHATFYVADLAAPPIDADNLLLARAAVFLWAENLQVSMAARLGAVRSHAAGDVYIGMHHDLGRSHRLSSTLLTDLAPLPEAGLVNLLLRHGGG